ncbi:hypothetical protein [Burkholderia vietnamiensis]|uniref:hypothetical protein n=1 Tax=Burkholderia vietnamiensis TaxID=60552 RepID=UPI0015934383|nr:hypothetical protein [Burkholderia vietnamiensis]
MNAGQQIKIPSNAGVRFGGRIATIVHIKPQGTRVRLNDGKEVTFCFDALQAAFARAAA